MEGDLEDVAGRVGLDRGDIKKIKRRRLIERFTMPVFGLMIILFSFAIGYLSGTNSEPRHVITNTSSYPYGTIGILAFTGFVSRNKFLITIVAILTAILSFVAYSSAFEMGRPIFELAIEYGVYDGNHHDTRLVKLK